MEMYFSCRERAKKRDVDATEAAQLDSVETDIQLVHGS